MRLLTLRQLAGRSAYAGSCAQERELAAAAKDLAAAPSLIPKSRKAQGLVPVEGKDSKFKFRCSEISLGADTPTFDPCRLAEGGSELLTSLLFN